MVARYDGVADWYDENFAHLGEAFIDAGLILRRVEELHQVVVPFELALDTEKAA